MESEAAAEHSLVARGEKTRAARNSNPRNGLQIRRAT